MAHDYNALYQTTPHALGETNRDIAAFFAATDARALRVLDIGCGQGRDALAIARLGHSVHGVDLAEAGIAAMLADARAEGLAISGTVADITTYRPQGLFDVLLIDRTLHMLEETSTRHACFARLLGHLVPGGVLLLVDEKSNMAGLRGVMEATGRNWQVMKAKGGTLFARG